ncbi:hypothetical protein MA16_Dca026363 [Dendrobium catenatum]|uniref:Uncharacterized protein n=1 Tax=Dendrobium catenatum TaxID=906689 RepID=A0A2I0VA42_9ASPA|nr:hypothetical protein MA16_Dca026363 [Dendrobium catenatum]
MVGVRSMGRKEYSVRDLVKEIGGLLSRTVGYWIQEWVKDECPYPADIDSPAAEDEFQFDQNVDQNDSRDDQIARPYPESFVHEQVSVLVFLFTGTFRRWIPEHMVQMSCPDVLPTELVVDDFIFRLS